MKDTKTCTGHHDCWGCYDGDCGCCADHSCDCECGGCEPICRDCSTTFEGGIDLSAVCVGVAAVVGGVVGALAYKFLHKN